MSSRIRIILVVLGCAFGLFGLTSAAVAARVTTKVSVALPRPGDVSFAVAQVRVVTPARPAAGRGKIFATRVGGVAIAASAPGWSALRKTTRVYAVVSPIARAGSKVRQVMLIVVRRRGGTSRSGSVTFAMPGATAEAKSFWVRKTNRHGYAQVFAVHDALSTALGNWERYLAVLKAARALAAAMHPVVGGPPQATARTSPRPARAAAGGSSPKQFSPTYWTGGQHADALTLRLAQRLLTALSDKTAFAAMKTDPMVAAFIITNLDNPALAARWQRVVTALPPIVPDKYAFAAKQEAQFGNVRAPGISRHQVRIADARNALDVATETSVYRATRWNSVEVRFDGSGDGRVTAAHLDCATTYDGAPSWSCLQTYAGNGPLTLTAVPAAGSVVLGWTISMSEPGLAATCGALSTSCTIQIDSETGPHREITVTPLFGHTGAQLTVAMTGAGTGRVTSDPAGIDCGATCVARFPPLGKVVTLTATPASGSTLYGWTGCDGLWNNTCTVLMSADRTVSASFIRPP